MLSPQPISSLSYLRKLCISINHNHYPPPHTTPSRPISPLIIQTAHHMFIFLLCSLLKVARSCRNVIILCFLPSRKRVRCFVVPRSMFSRARLSTVFLFCVVLRYIFSTSTYMVGLVSASSRFLDCFASLGT
ncbi:hypothetical protein HGRIS_000340 [Hohenbuehelia grisea]|uniref:Uncharacterized protein n=1 Tax=Hohenbuehelia grisea TaxID=104357 RepID=A0ABR3JRP7_9AGAR